MEALEFFDGASAALSLMTRLRELLEHCEKEQDPSLRETLIQLKAYSLRSAEGLRATLDNTLQALQALDISTDQTLRAADKSISYWQLWKKTRLKRVLAPYWNIQSNMKSFVSDVEALLCCAGKGEQLAAGTGAYEIRKELNQLFAEERPIKDLHARLVQITEDTIKLLK